MPPRKPHRRAAQETPLPGKRRVVYAPQSNHMSIPAAVISVELGKDEKVEWQWTHFADGRSCVTGCTIFKKADRMGNGA